MPTSTPAALSHRPPSFHQSIKAYLATWVELLKVRLELLSTEWQEECQRLEQILLLAATAVACLALGVLCITLLVVAVFWDTDYRLAVVGGFAGLYLALGVAAGLLMRRKTRSKPRLFATTLSELAKDLQHLSS
jgi:uncharacterized membrane protein YqjE